MSYSFKTVITPETHRDNPELFLEHIPVGDVELACRTYQNLTKTLMAPDFPFEKFAERNVIVTLSNKPEAEELGFHINTFKVDGGLSNEGLLTVRLEGFHEKPSLEQWARQPGEVRHEKAVVKGSNEVSGEPITADEFRAEAARILCCLFNNNPGETVRANLEFCNTIFAALKAGVSDIGALGKLAIESKTDRAKVKVSYNLVVAKFPIGGSLDSLQNLRGPQGPAGEQKPVVPVARPQ